MVAPALETLLAGLSLDHKVRQLVCPVLDPTQAPPPPAPWGGVILQAGSKAEVKALVAALQEASEIPLLVAADVENGAAQTLTDGVLLPTALAIGATGDVQGAWAAGVVTARECREVGINWALAPVVDVNSQPDNPIINVRAFSDDAGTVAAFGSAFIQGCQAGRVLATAKHFPGHGDTSQDSHLELPLVAADRETLGQRELAPFVAAIGAGVGAVMTAHVAVPALDASGLPATFSPAVMTDLLREDLGFAGLVVTDALIMGGVTEVLAEPEAAVRAVTAGCDVLLAPADPEAVVAALLAAVADGTLSEARIDESVRRILQAKDGLGLWEAAFAAGEDVAAIGRELAWDLSVRAVSLLRNDGGLLPLSEPAACTVLHVESPFVAIDRVWMRVLQGEGFTDVRLVGRAAAAPDLEAELAAITGPVLISVVPIAIPWRGVAGLTEAQQAAFAGLAARCEVGLVLLGSPYLIRALPHAKAVVCTYAYGSESMLAAIGCLKGELDPVGRLPVTVSEDLPRGFGLGFGLGAG